MIRDILRDGSCPRSAHYNIEDVGFGKFSQKYGDMGYDIDTNPARTEERYSD